MGADPSVDGLPRPVGWRVQLADGSNAWDKTGTGDTDWTPVGSLIGVTKILAGTGIAVSPIGGTGNVTVSTTGGGGVTSLDTQVGDIELSSTSPGLGINNVPPTDILFTQYLAADWDPTTMRVYAIDGVNGNDNNVGFADLAALTAPAYATACAAAGAVAWKTFAPLASLFPRNGCGRNVEIVIAAGTYTGSLADFLNGTQGYKSLTVRGTATNTTAGAVAFAGSTADATYVGGATSTGLNAAGYTPAGSISTSSIQCTKVGGAAPAFAAIGAVPLGQRIRFDSATTTAALRNICRSVANVPASDIVTTQTVEPALPVAGDTFYTEQPGVIVAASTLINCNPGQGVQLVGIKINGDFALNSGRATMAFCECANFSTTTVDRFGTQQSYTHAVLGSLTVGGGLRNAGTGSVSAGTFALAGLVTTSQMTVLKSINVLWGAGCATRNLYVLDLIVGQNDNNQQNPSVGVAAATSVGVPFTWGASGGGGVNIDGCIIAVGNLVVSGAGASPAVKMRGKSSIVVLGTISGSTGNTDVGMDLQNAVLSTIEYRAGLTPTVTGTAGDIRYANQALGVWTNHNFEETYDQAQNHIWCGNTNGAAYPASMSAGVSNGVHVNASGADGAYTIMRQSGASNQVTPAFADTVAHLEGVVGVLLAAANNGAACLYGGMSGYKLCQFDGAPTLGAIAYVSNATAGFLTTTVPPASVTQGKLRVGIVLSNAYAGNLALVRMTPELLPVLADGQP